MSGKNSIEADLERFFTILDYLRHRVGGERYLSSCTGRMGWPRQGVYFFFEPGETRASSKTPRVVRVGTHAVSSGSKTTLWDRLRTHRGTLMGGGNHRGSIFRLHVGSALLAGGDFPAEVFHSWGVGGSAPKEIKIVERELERRVSEYVGKMPFLWLKVEDKPGTGSLRKFIERNSIAIMSNASKNHFDLPSPGWLGHRCKNEAVRVSGLWNVDHVFEAYEPGFLEVFERLIKEL